MIARCYKPSLLIRSWQQKRFMSYGSSLAFAEFAYVQSGQATLVAQQVDHITRFTELSHKAPCRLIPIPKAGSKVGCIALGHYGGGMTAGDQVRVDLRVEEGAFVHLTTQGTNRVYKQKDDVNDDDISKHAHSEQSFNVVVESGSTCVITPDPTQLQAGSMYRQRGKFDLKDSTSSLVLVDWISAGRLTAGERWKHAHCRLRTEITVNGQVAVLDAQSLDTIRDVDWMGGLQLQAIGTIFLHNTSPEVIQRLQRLQRVLCRPYTAIRSAAEDSSSEEFDASILSGRTLLGVSQVGENSLYVARFAASTNEDIYRAINWSLEPLGISCYKERITAHRSAPPIQVDDGKMPGMNDEVTTRSELAGLSPRSTWAALMLSDSNFPTGAFAHSAGLEAAHQLGLVKSPDTVARFLRAVVQSSINQSVPLIRLGYHGEPGSVAWSELDAYAHALLAPNTPACEASIDQGRNLLRVAKYLDENDSNGERYDILQQHLDEDPSSRGHMAPLWGLIGRQTFALTEDEACTLFSFTVARDIVSAAVRLNLIGPLEGQRMLKQCVSSTQIPEPGEESMGSAPVLDAVHTNHTIMAMRLFRT